MKHMNSCLCILSVLAEWGPDELNLNGKVCMMAKQDYKRLCKGINLRLFRQMSYKS